MDEDSTVYVGFDVSKAKHAVAIAEPGRTGEVRYFGEIETSPAAVERFVRKLGRGIGGCIFATKLGRRAMDCSAS